MFAISSAGEITVAAALDYETRSSYTLTVRVTDGGITGDTTAKSGTGTVVVNVENVAEPPVLGDLTGAVNENDADAEISPAMSTVLSDPDGVTGQTFFYTIISGNDGGLFLLNPATGQVSLSQALDYESDIQHVLTISVTDGTGLSDTGSYTINVQDRPEPPIIERGQAFAVDENSNAASGSIGTINVTDVDSSPSQLTFQLIASSGSDKFSLSTTGVLSLSSTFSPDYE